MRTEFTAPHRSLSVHAAPGEDVIGPGQPGAKSAALVKYRPLFEGGFGMLPQVAITPAFFTDFLGRAGASHHAPEESRAAIAGTAFTKGEKDAMRAAAAPFSGLYAAVRSDEAVAGGIGLWSSGFALLDGSEAAAAKVEALVRGILASDFSHDVIAFKNRTGMPLEATPGAFIMPVDACSISTLTTYTTQCHVNAISDFTRGDTLVQLGHGLGGANAHYARVALLSELDMSQFRFISEYHMDHARVFSSGSVMELRDDAFGREAGAMALRMHMQRADTVHIPALRAGFGALKAKNAPPLYLELSYGCNCWDVVQCAEASLGSVVRPAEDGRKVLTASPSPRDRLATFGLDVLGRGVAESGTIVYLGQFDMADTLAGINRMIRGYVLVMEHGLRALDQLFSFADYSNAAAIVSTQQNMRPAMSHVSGALREAGIPLLAGNMDRGFLRELHGHNVHARNVLVYANDAREEGFMLDRS
jgi:hypothetical protein